jgi:hypothetical protein
MIMDETGKNPSDTKMTAIKTSQTSWSLPEGGSSGSTGPGTIPENGGGKGSFTATSQQIRGEHSKIEGAEQGA